MNREEIIRLIDEKVDKRLRFSVKLYGDTPTDANQLVPKQYVDANSGGNPAGVDGSVQYNNGGSFGGDNKFVWDDSLLAEKLTLTNDNATAGILLDVQNNTITRSGSAGQFNIVGGGSNDLFISGGDGTNPPLGDVFLSSGSVLTTATKGFVSINTCPGTPTGVPIVNGGGRAPMIFDDSNKKLYVYSGGWVAMN